jgi:glycosyltransferase involved in cell wall biosynthesis
MEDFAGRWCPPESPTMLFVGRLSPEKGLEDLFSAMRLLATSGRNATLVVAGSGPADYVTALRDTARSLDVDRHVWFIGSVDGDRLRHLYRTSSVTVVPSRMEAFGRVVIEAMASGCPVVATDVGGLGALVDDGSNGWKVPGADPEKLADALWHAVSDPTEASVRARRARSVVVESYGSDRVVAMTADVYARVVS